MRKTLLLAAMGAALAFSPGGGLLSAQQGRVHGEWRYYGADAASTKYSPLDQITEENAKNLRVAWRWKADNFGPRPDTYFQATPLMIDGVLYTTAGMRRNVVAIDAATGETLWVYRVDEGARGAQSPMRSGAGRGVSYWTDGKSPRIFHVTLGYRLVALDPKTGQPLPGFGQRGMVDLTQELPRPVPGDGYIGYNSPTMVVGDVVIVGSAFGFRTNQPVHGAVRAYDVRTGKLRWTFNTIPRREDPAAATWKNGSLEYASHVGVWAPMSADLDLGYVYLPVETPTTDLYGGHRPGDNLYAESLVCVDAKTGKRVWHYQLIHHGLWDWDIPTQPILLDVTANGRRIKAVAQITKQAFVYVFDRVTGEPVWPIEERPVPQSDVPTEMTSPTQPFPTKPAPFDRQGIGPDDLIDFTPELKAEALKVLSTYRYGPMFTPPSLMDPNGTKGTIFLPSMAGGANWQGGAADPETGILYVASATLPSVAALRPCETPNPGVPTMKYCGGGSTAMNPTVNGLPLVKPPWGRITAIDLNTGDHLWMITNADTPDVVKNHPMLKGVTLPRTGRPDRSGIIVTKTLLFAGEGTVTSGGGTGAGGRMFRAYDKRTGEIVSEMELPAYQTGIPLTYMAGGKQYIAMTIGAPNHNGELVALALP